jgi:predicted dehydrogenase
MTNRREFLKTGVLGGAGLLFSSYAFGTSARPIKGANDRINVAVVGLRGIGQSHLSSYRRQADSNVRIAALCDCDSEYLDKMLASLAKDDIRPKSYRDLRKLLDDKDVDAVSLGMPNYWHALATVWACQAGKHVCVEKPVSHSIWEGRKMVEAARKYKRMVQADLDTRSNPSVTAAIDYMQKNLGKVLYVRIVNYKRRFSIGKIKGPGIIPVTCDYDLHTGPLPMMPLPRKELHYDWHWQWLTGNGELGNNGPHQLDVCRWALGKQNAPQKVLSFGGRFGYTDDGNVPNTQVAWYDYDGIPVIYDSRALGEKTGIDNMDGFTGHTATGKKVHHPYRGGANCSIYIFCENGYLVGDSIFNNDGERVKRFEEPGKVGPQTNFIRALRSGRQEDLKTDILEGHLSANISHIGNISYQTGRQASLEELRQTAGKYPYLEEVFLDFDEHLRLNGVDPAKEELFLGRELTFDSTSERFTGEHSDIANLFLKDNYREPFVIPEKV